MRISDWSSDVCSSDLPESRNRLPRDGEEQGQAIDPAVLAHGGNDSERYCQCERKTDGKSGEDGRYRKAAHDEIADRQAKVVAGTEVAANRAAEPVEVLDDQRPVETILPADGVHVRDAKSSRLNSSH